MMHRYAAVTDRTLRAPAEDQRFYPDGSIKNNNDLAKGSHRLECGPCLSSLQDRYGVSSANVIAASSVIA
jgi:hypothetical protein